MSKKQRLSIGDMIQCPYCKAMSYPRLFREPKNDEEKKAIFCGSCKANLTPYLESMEKFSKKMETEWKSDQPSDSSLILTNDEGKQEIYPNAEKIVSEVLTDLNNEAIVSSSLATKDVT
jgi:hypothetical protein